MKKSILRGFAVTLFVFITMQGCNEMSKLNAFSAFDPIGQALTSFELTDYVFSNLREQPNIEERIVLVNLGHSRMEIAQQVSAISQYKPKVIGIDGFFNCEGGFYDTLNCPQLKDTLANLMLSSAIEESGNVVLVSRLLQSDSVVKFNEKATKEGRLDDLLLDVYDSMEYSDPMFSQFAHNAFANLPTGLDASDAATYQEDVKICKSVFPKLMVNGKEELAFSVRMAMLYDSVKTKNFLARDNEEEVINFRGNITIDDVKIKSLRDAAHKEGSDFNVLCYALDHDQITLGEFDSTQYKTFHNAVVIIGYLGDYFGDTAWEDKFFTPMNTKVAGRANPDMFGPVIHANVVAMILNEDYVDELPFSWQVIIAAVICFLNVLMFWWIDNKFPVLYDGLSVIIQLVQLLLISSLVVYAFAKYSVKLELALTLAAVALIGPCFDIWKSVENSLFKPLTPKEEAVLTPQEQEIV
jgi:hypothetical protein